MTRTSLFAALLTLLFLAGCKHVAERRRWTSPFEVYLRDTRSRLVVYSPDVSDDGILTSRLVEAQLRRLRMKFDGIILYSVDNEARLILNVAKELHFRAVLLTIWDPRSSSEIGAAAELANSYGEDLALAFSIGSEGLLEKRYRASDLLAAREELLGKLDKNTSVGVTTSEPWWLYSRSGSDGLIISSLGSFICPIIHVTWDADIGDGVEAARWTLGRAIELQRTVRSIVLVREAGFPGSGTSPRIPSKHFTRLDQAAFWFEMEKLLAQQQENASLRVAAFEGIDNQKKVWRDFEQSWGLLSRSELQPYLAWDAFADIGY